MNTVELLDLTLEDAIKRCEEHNFAHRVIYADGEYFFATQDYRTDRVNFKLENNIVVAAHIG